MSKKCGNQHTDLWGNHFVCTRNKDHHGEHTSTELVRWPSRGKTPQFYWKTEHWFNYDRYCGKPMMGNSYRCELKPGHKRNHKSFVFRTYITWKELTNG